VDGELRASPAAEADLARTVRAGVGRSDRPAERLEGGLVERAARADVGDADVDVIDEVGHARPVPAATSCKTIHRTSEERCRRRHALSG